MSDIVCLYPDNYSKLPIFLPSVKFCFNHYTFMKIIWK